MALSKKENKLKNTMDCIQSDGVDIGYANVLRWMIDKNGYVVPDVIRYGSEEKRRENPEQHLPPVGFGWQLPKKIQKEIWDFIGAKCYPYLELQIQLQPIIKEMETADKEKMEELQKKIDDLYDKMKLEKPS